MRFKISTILELIVPLSIALLLAGCFGTGGGGPTYDGLWTVRYLGPTPAQIVQGATVACTLPTPLPTVTLVNGAGSTSQTDTCDNILTASGVATVVQSPKYTYLISVAVTLSTNVVNAQVNGVPFTGECISAHGCAAQAGTTSTLSLTR
jgi:hypothetical protein